MKGTSRILRSVNTEKTLENIFYTDGPTQLIRASFPLLINLDDFNGKIDPAQQNSPAESSCELMSALLIHGDQIYLS